MGTQRSNQGPRNKMPLLPDWADDSDAPYSPDNQGDLDSTDDGHQDTDRKKDDHPVVFPIRTGDWGNAKRGLSSFVNNPAQYNLRSAARSYVRAGGGARNLARSAISGKATAGRLANFLTGITNEGLERTYERLAIGSLEGLSVEMVFNRIAAVLAPTGATIEESIAQAALVDALSKLYEDYDLGNNEITSLDDLSKDEIPETIRYYISSYIFERWLNELGIKIENKEVSPAQVVELEDTIKDFIDSSVVLEFGDGDFSQMDFGHGEGKKIIDRIFEQAYSVIEVL